MKGERKWKTRDGGEWRRKEKNPISSRPVSSSFSASAIESIDHGSSSIYPYPQNSGVERDGEKKKNVTLVCRVPWNYSSLHVMSAKCTCMYGHSPTNMMMMAMTRERKEFFLRVRFAAFDDIPPFQKKAPFSISSPPSVRLDDCQVMKESITSIRAQHTKSAQHWDSTEMSWISFFSPSPCRRDMFNFPMALFHSSDWYCFAPENSLSISWNLSAVSLKSLDVYPLAVVVLDVCECLCVISESHAHSTAFLAWKLNVFSIWLIGRKRRVNASDFSPIFLSIFSSWSVINNSGRVRNVLP